MREHGLVWSLILAAGAASRFGAPKALAPWSDGTLLSHSLRRAAAITGHKTMVVTGAYEAEMTSHLDQVWRHFHANWREGMGSSLAAGVRAIVDTEPRAQAVLILLADQPLIDATYLARLVQKGERGDQCILSRDGDIIGPPAFLPRRFFGAALSLSGDKGLKSALPPDGYRMFDAAGFLDDVDTPHDLERLRVAR